MTCHDLLFRTGIDEFMLWDIVHQKRQNYTQLVYYMCLCIHMNYILCCIYAEHKTHRH